MDRTGAEVNLTLARDLSDTRAMGKNDSHMLGVYLDEETRKLYDEAAAREGLSLSAWARKYLTPAADARVPAEGADLTPVELATAAARIAFPELRGLGEITAARIVGYIAALLAPVQPSAGPDPVHPLCDPEAGECGGCDAHTAALEPCSCEPCHGPSNGPAEAEERR